MERLRRLLGGLKKREIMEWPKSTSDLPDEEIKKWLEHHEAHNAKMAPRLEGEPTTDDHAQRTKDLKKRT